GRRGTERWPAFAPTRSRTTLEGLPRPRLRLAVPTTPEPGKRGLRESSFASVRRSLQLAKNCSSIGARGFAFTLCVWPSRTRCWALGRTCASARVPLWNHLGLLPPTTTSVGMVTDLHRSAGNGRPAGGRRWIEAP